MVYMNRGYILGIICEWMFLIHPAVASIYIEQRLYLGYKVIAVEACRQWSGQWE